MFSLSQVLQTTGEVVLFVDIKDHHVAALDVFVSAVTVTRARIVTQQETGREELCPTHFPSLILASVQKNSPITNTHAMDQVLSSSQA